MATTAAGASRSFKNSLRSVSSLTQPPHLSHCHTLTFNNATFLRDYYHYYPQRNTHQHLSVSSRRGVAFATGREATTAAFAARKNKDTGVTSSTSPTKLTAAQAAAAAKRRVPREIEEYWTRVLESVDKPTAKKLIPFVDPSLPLGLPDPGAKGTRPPMFSYFLATKLAHPDKIILCRIGEFYETIGIDAILLVQHAGLNPMGREGNPPRAGCPRVNLRRTVSDLVENAGLSVVVCNEVPESYEYGKKKPPRERFIADIVTPASPHFVHGLIDEDADLALDSAPPLIGIAPRVGGLAVIEIDAELQTVRVTEGLTEDAVYARLHEGGLAPPLFVHIPPASSGSDKRLTESISEVEWERRISGLFRNQVGAIQRYDDVDPVQGMVERVKRLLNLPADILFRELPAASPKTRPRP